MEEEEEAKCGAFLSWFTQAAIDNYEKNEGVTKTIVNEYRVNESKRCIRERKHWYDLKYRRDAYFYPVNN